MCSEASHSSLHRIEHPLLKSISPGAGLRQRSIGDHAVAAASAAFERPEQIAVSACIRNAYIAVGSDYFGFERASAGRTIVLRETAKAATLNQTRHAYGRAPSPLNIFPAPAVTASYACIQIVPAPSVIAGCGCSIVTTAAAGGLCRPSR